MLSPFLIKPSRDSCFVTSLSSGELNNCIQSVHKIDCTKAYVMLHVVQLCAA